MVQTMSSSLLSAAVYTSKGYAALLTHILVSFNIYLPPIQPLTANAPIRRLDLVNE